MNLQPCGQTLDRQVEALVYLRTVRRERVYLSRFVRTTTKPRGRPAAGIRPDDDHIAVKGSPLALHPVEAVSEVEDEIEPGAFSHRPIDVDSSSIAAFAIASSAIAPLRSVERDFSMFSF